MTLGFIKQLLRTWMVSDEMLLLVIETGLQTAAVNYGGNVLFPLVQQDNSRTQHPQEATHCCVPTKIQSGSCYT